VDIHGQMFLPLESATAAVLAVAAFVALRLYPIWNSRFQGCDAYNILLCAESLRQAKRLPIRLPPVYLLEEQEQWYPPGFLVFCALLPPAWLQRNYGLLNHLVDLVQVAIIYAAAVAAGYPAVGVLAVLAYGMMPALIQEYASLNTRPLGTALQACFLIAVFFSAAQPAAVAAMVLGVLLFYSHKLSLQQLWFTLPMLTVLTGEWRWLGWLAGLYLASAIVWPRGFLRILQGHVAIVRFWHRYWPLLGAHAVRQSPIYGDGATRTDFYAPRNGSGVLAFAKEALHQNYFAVPALAIALLKAPLAPSDLFLLGWMVSTYAAAILIHHLPALRAIGLGRQYVKFGIVPSLLLLVLNADLASPALLLIAAAAAILEIRQYLLVARNMRTQGAGQVGRVSAELDRLLDLLRNAPGCRVMCLPTHLCDLVAYRARIPTYWGTHSHCFDEKLADFFPVLRKPLAEYARADGLTHLLLDRNYAAAAELGLDKESLVAQAGSYDLYAIGPQAREEGAANTQSNEMEAGGAAAHMQKEADVYSPSSRTAVPTTTLLR